MYLYTSLWFLIFDKSVALYTLHATHTPRSNGAPTPATSYSTYPIRGVNYIIYHFIHYTGVYIIMVDTVELRDGQDSNRKRKRENQQEIRRIKVRENQQEFRRRIKENSLQYRIQLLCEQSRQSKFSYKSRKRERESTQEYKLKALARKQKNTSTLHGFDLYQKCIYRKLRNDLLGYLKEEFAVTATRSRCKNEAAITIDNYGREFIIQTRAFCAFVVDMNSKCILYTRSPHSLKYSVPINTCMLEDEKQRSVMDLSKLVQLVIPKVRDLVLYLVQCIIYDGQGNRGPHIDGIQNGGDVIVGCDIGGGKRSLGIGKDHIFQIGMGSIYVMSDNVRYNCTHDPKKISKGDSPYVIIFRYGLAKIEENL